MKYLNTIKNITLIYFVIIGIITVGCSAKSPLVEFYSLSPMHFAENKLTGNATDQELSIGVGPTFFPGEINRPQIVTRTSANKLHVAQFHQWGSPLQKNFSKILAENLSLLLGTDNVAVFPWQQYFRPTYRVVLDIRQFDGIIGETAYLDAIWTITDANGEKALLVKKSYLQEPAAGAEYENLVHAQSKLVAVLSQEIANEIRRLKAAPPSEK
jgi:uncharacterized lipoprotein YmbA